MRTTVRLFIISAMIILPWAFIRLTDREMTVIAWLNRVHLSDAAVVALLLLPPLLWFLIGWLFRPRTKAGRGYSGKKDVFIKFRG
jgi:hypothetical protein